MKIVFGDHFEIGLALQVLFGVSLVRMENWWCFALNIGPVWMLVHPKFG